MDFMNMEKDMLFLKNQNIHLFKNKFNNEYNFF